MWKPVYLENARALVQGSFVLIFVGVAYFINLQIGLILVFIQGCLIVQSSFTNWCIPDPALKRIGFKRKCE
ncbi:MAG: DUF2892 domain-containing protein [Candidatus Thorarchaeota archaeon]|nr:DUF2892 domain-containing protein [Candidatus Thorarchaeota archaeon]